MKHGNWTVIFPDKRIIKKTDDFNIETGRGYVIDDDAFWNQSKFSNLHAIQFTDDNTDNDLTSPIFGDDRTGQPNNPLSGFDGEEAAAIKLDQEYSLSANAEKARAWSNDEARENKPRTYDEWGK